MTLPEKALLKRRRQILDDETGAAHRFNVDTHQDTSRPEDALRQDIRRQDIRHQDAQHPDALHQDTWARNFVDRLARLIQKIGGNNQA
jgi:hypothetical protein